MSAGRVGLGLDRLNTGTLGRCSKLKLSLAGRIREKDCSVRDFHVTRRNQMGPPLILALLGTLKSSTALGIANTVVRVAMTLVPAIVVKHKMLRKWIRKIPEHMPQWEHKLPHLTKMLRYNKILLRVLFLLPTILIAATMLASLERAPLTGRWRLILLSAEEEDQIAKQLAGNGWRAAVASILSSTSDSATPPEVIPPQDWRAQWVESTLRRLEHVIPVLQIEQSLDPHKIRPEDPEVPFPPPSKYPLLPRPRATQMLRAWCSRHVPSGEEQDHVPAHTLLGPPYSVLLVDKPDSRNAFSYGFGPHGAGGVVVYSGFLDEILQHSPNAAPPPATVPANTIMPSFWSQLFGSLLSSPKRTSTPVPTEEQTTELAVLLAHELAHLVLSHHLETLSSATILIPSVVSIFTDVVRTVMFPFTMFFGPFVNDALAQMSKVGSGEISKRGEICSGRKMEIEADVVSARLLAYAGFDPREAIKFWERRIDQNTECSADSNLETPPQGSWAMGQGVHPLNQERVLRLRQELTRWEKVWAEASHSH
ncbi:hypothetical protein SISNIDRAFT_485120 [Sistotremastrum niveocremeum HHB9708]|uniref:Peptidase M48 domain-containing protein n=1 Tax=Sistotremastrum niveocremeum HHB9708 TaxID=1314777 RepID=A0A164VIW4_9AGAM|nr:hypothetical protein SISNIDRAFT_485120 [Sistotremastrum niveocremeum HHB9708]